MTVQCPHCGSANTYRSSSVTTTATGVGALGGIAVAVSQALNKGIPTTGVPQFAAGILISSIFSGLAGSLFGAQIGSELERTMPPKHHCNQCGHSFTSMKQLS